MHWFTSSLFHAAVMIWEMLWALVLGFCISAILQVYVSKEQMARIFGKNGLREVALAMGFGTASSSCSYAAAATMKTVFKKGAAFMPSLAFLIASTNLVIELGIVLCLLMGWRFLFAELVGACVMVAVAWAIFSIHPPRELIDEARKHKEEKENGHDHASEGKNTKLIQTADAFFMDWSMLGKEIVVGVLIAGFLMVLVPRDWWQIVFLSHGPYPLRLIENAFVGPLIAMASFVCSVGNVPLASLLWSNGATFGGVIAFIYGDLIVLPLVFIYRKYYGTKAALYIAGVLYIAMVVAGIGVDLLFAGLGLAPHRGTGASSLSQAGFSWNYTTWLNLAALLCGGCLVCLHMRRRTSNKGLYARSRRKQHAHG